MVSLSTTGDRMYPQTAGYKDEDCSKEAASKVNKTLNERQIAVYHALITLDVIYGGATAEQVADYLELAPESVKPRLTELQHKGWVVKTGRKGKTKMGGSCAIWAINPCKLTEKEDNN